jgi:hypothetical protein
MDAVRPAKPEQSNSDQMVNRAGHNPITFTVDQISNLRPVQFVTLGPRSKKQCRLESWRLAGRQHLSTDTMRQPAVSFHSGY